MEKKHESHIRVTQSTKQRIKTLNKGNSYEENITAVLDYVERTGVNPWALKEHPIEVTQKGFDRIIAIQKNIEKTKIDEIIKKLVNIEKLLLPFADRVENSKETPASTKERSNQEGNLIGTEEGQITLEELTAIVETNQAQQEQIGQLQGEIKNLNGKIYELSNSKPDGGGQEVEQFKRSVSEVANVLERGARKASFGSDFTIKQADYNTVLQSLKNIIK